LIGTSSELNVQILPYPILLRNNDPGTYSLNTGCFGTHNPLHSTIRRLFLHLISIQSILKRLEDKFVIGLIVYMEGYLSDEIVAANQMLIAIKGIF
jgi:hypothetical protein